MTMEDNEEAIRTMVMNVVLFLPFGLTLPYVFDHIKNKLFFVKHFSRKKASEFPVFSKGFSLL